MYLLCYAFPSTYFEGIGSFILEAKGVSLTLSVEQHITCAIYSTSVSIPQIVDRIHIMCPL